MSVKRIKDRIDGNEIDLSLSDLTEVPEKDLALYPKATHVDLSRNLLTTLSPTFADLKHIVKLDLSKNKLTELPTNFGHLNRLKYLDLYGNKLAMLPVSFCQLKNLKWLDLKDNPLDKQLGTVAGDCLDEKQCEASAKNVVVFMQSIQSQLERERQKRLKQEQEQQRLIKAAEEKEKMRIKMEKQLAKEKRKAEHQARKRELENVNEKKHENEPTVIKEENKVVQKTKIKESVKPKSSRSIGCFFSAIFTLVLLVLVSVAAVVIYDHIKFNQPFTYVRLLSTCQKYYILAQGQAQIYFDLLTKCINQTSKLVVEYYKNNFKT